MLVTKRNHSTESLDLEKFHAVVARSCSGITGVSASEIELRSRVQFESKIKTSDIQETLIKAASGLITEETPNYQYVAGRLINYHLRKEAYGDFNPPVLLDHVKKLVGLGYYDSDLLSMYDEKEWKHLNKMVDHRRDELLTYVAMEQFRGKYLVRNRVSGEFFETPQMAYILIAAVLFGSYPKESRMAWIADFYDATSTHQLSLATPILAGIRTPQRQFSSCTLIEVGDSLDSIIAASGIVKKYVSARAGIGLSSQIRSDGDLVKKGAVRHTGKIPYWKGFAADIGTCSQGGVRKGSGTMNETIFDYEIMELLELRNHKGTEETRCHGLDYCFHLNKLFYQRYMEDGNVTLFSRGSAPEVFRAFYRNDPNFQEIYEKAERSHIIRKKSVSAVTLIEKLLEERFNTGRVYIMNIDHANEHGSFIPELAAIKTTNLCVEITLPTHECNDVNDPDGEVALCTLMGINVGTSSSDMPRLARLAVRALNCLIDYQDYEVPAARNATMNRRPIGVGMMNLAYFLAKNGSNYSTPNLELVHDLAEDMMFNLIKASMELAKEDPSRIPLKFNETKYSKGIMPVDHYKKAVDTLVSNDLKHDWAQLAADVVLYGMANSTVAAGMPGETSSQIINGTRGVDPIRGIVMTKKSKEGVLTQVAPEPRKLKNKYELLWDMPNTTGYLSIMAVIQKFWDQSISSNTTYNPTNYPDDVVPMEQLVEDLFFAYRMGIKTLYYNNTAPLKVDDTSSDTQVALQPEPESEEIEICDGCSL
jgi:ribonucleoside-diphosphate reductase alpha chain